MTSFRILFHIAALLALAACSNPKDTPLPHDPAKLETIKSSLESLTPDERALLTQYVMRTAMVEAMGAIATGKAAAPAPDAMTIGKAIETQRAFNTQLEADQAKEKARKAKLEAERAAAMKAMRDLVSVKMLARKMVVERGISGMVLDESLAASFQYENHGTKPISGVKGLIVVKDVFGDKLSSFAISNDTTMPPGASITWKGSRSVKFAFGSENQDRKLAELPDEKVKVEWEPEMIVFADGTSLKAPEAE